MISQFDFNNFLNEIEETFGRKYPQRQRDKLFTRIGNMFGEKTWNAAVDELTMGKFMPSAKELIETLYRENRAHAVYASSTDEKKVYSASLCNLCYGHGFVEANKKEFRGAPFVFRCDCRHGNQQPSAWPLWRNAKPDEFEQINWRSL